MRRIEWIVLAAILVLAAAARLWFLGAGVPHAVGVDEPQVIDRALRILHTGDWNTHLFDYPSLVIYLHAGMAIVRFLWGALNGEWASLDAYSIAAVYQAGRAATAVIGAATVWLTWRLARELSGRAVALLAAAQLAVNPLHVRESHYALTDVPMTALAMLALWLAVRASRIRTVAAYAWAGATCGLAAAAEYNGGAVVVAVAAVWLLYEHGAADRGRKAAAIAGAAVLAFLIAAPYTLLDMPAFLDGFAGQFSRVAAPGRAVDPAWRTYLIPLAPPYARWWVAAGLSGVAILWWHHRTRKVWTPLIVFAYFYVLASHSHVFGRYALPLVPVLCILTSVAIVELVRVLHRLPALSTPIVLRLMWTITLAVVLWPAARETVHWLDALKQPDTRSMAADWLKMSVPRGTRLAVENSGPTYLDSAGFRVVGTELLLAQPVDWYRQRADYLVISTVDLSRYGDYVAAGPVVFQVEPSPQRWGPPIRIVSLKAPASR